MNESSAETLVRRDTMKKVATATGPAALTLRWVPVTDASGRTRMEMRWSAPTVVARRTAAA